MSIVLPLPAGVEFVFRSAEPALWSSVINDIDYVPVLYTEDSIDYLTAYCTDDAGTATDLSVVLRYGGVVAGIWPLTLVAGSRGRTVTSGGAPILPPLFVRGVTSRTSKRITTSLLEWLDRLVVEHNMPPWQSVDPFLNEATSGISEWHRQILSRGGRESARYDLFVDLTLDTAQIRKSFRKSFKPLINVGLAKWRVDVLAQADLSTWKAFKDLHRRVAGRATRSDESWALQHAAMASGGAFLVSLRADGGEMIGGGYFATSATEGAYSVAAYDRSLFDQPIGHVVQHVAIEEMKRRGLRWYLIGRRPYPQDKPAPSAKEISIGEFKQGFATHVFPRYLLTFAGQRPHLDNSGP